ncbi:MAG: glutamyl-Q tRNA(Asp) synthetase [Rubritalea sp.]|jgi:glutamyl-Q tRNA(Asp) synthetase|tara:strand:- start:45 stop:926 length:882 start_codon:yes stop_codon:yes gene_type:complete
MSLPPATIVKTRFAPSPTGHLHLGHLYAAQVAHDLARKLDGQYLLRFEDIDKTRTKDHYYASILDDLQFFKFQHDAPPISQIQSDRTEAYAAALAELNLLGVTYPCFCSRKDIHREISSLTNAPHGNHLSAQYYPGTCKKLTFSQRDELLEQGKIPSTRIHIDKAKELTGNLTFNDLIHGKITVDHDILGDSVLARRDIGTSYHIASVIDDAFQEITHITRGNDLLESTHLHRVLQHLLNFPEPTYLHHQLILDTNDERLAKRAQSISVKELREQGHSLDSLIAMIQLQLKTI